MINRFRRLSDDHPSPEALLLALEGQLSGYKARRVAEHLKSCWECRTRAAEYEAGIEAFVAYRSSLYLPAVPPVPTGWRGFDVRLQQRADECSRERPRGVFSSLRRIALVGWRLPLLTPSAVAIALLVSLSSLVILRRTPVLSAAELLQDARVREDAALASPGIVVHRVLHFEERRASHPGMVKQRRMEIWHRGGGGAKARRLYDEQNRLVSTEVGRVAPPGELDPWRLEPSTQDFNRLVGVGDYLSVEARAEEFRLIYGPPAETPSRILRATLTLRKQDLRPIEQTIVFGPRDAVVEYRVAETTFERLNAETVPRDRFEPEAVATEAPAATPPAPAALKTSPSAAVEIGPTEIELDAVEMDAAYRLHQMEACLQAPSGSSRATDRTLRLQVTVRSAACKIEADRRLEALGGRSWLEVRVAVTTDDRSVESNTADVRTAPVYATVRAHFASLARNRSEPNQPSDDTIDAAATEFVVSILERSHEALQQAQELDALVKRWTISELRTMEVDGVAKWQSMVRDHASTYRREVEGLRLQLQPIVFPSEATNDSPPKEVTDVSEVPKAAERLLELAHDQDARIRAAFLRSERPMTNPVDLQQLAAIVRQAELLAGGFAAPWAFF